MPPYVFLVVLVGGIFEFQIARGGSRTFGATRRDFKISIRKPFHSLHISWTRLWGDNSFRHPTSTTSGWFHWEDMQPSSGKERQIRWSRKVVFGKSVFRNEMNGAISHSECFPCTRLCYNIKLTIPSSSPFPSNLHKFPSMGCDRWNKRLSTPPLPGVAIICLPKSTPSWLRLCDT